MRALIVFVFSSSLLLGGSRLPNNVQSLPLTFEPSPEGAEFLARGFEARFELSASAGAVHLKGARVSWRLEGARDAAPAEGLNPMPGKANYFLGSDPAAWRTNVPLYQRVRFSDVYPGISLVYYGNQSRLEYDFEVRPGADPSRIAMSFSGVEDVSIGENGDLVLRTRDGELRHRKPFVYQERQGRREVIEASYALARGGRVTFDIASYDRSQPLVIDPVLLYSSYFGGTDDDEPAEIAVDSTGIYIVGATDSGNFAGRSGYRGNTDAFVTKLNPDGNSVLYSVYLGGGGTDLAHGLFVDSAGNAYVGGATGSVDFPTTTNAFITAYRGGNSDGFVAKINPQGNTLLYSTFLGGFGNDSVNDVTADPSGNAYATGQTNANNFPVTFGSFQTFRIGIDFDVFVSKLSTTSPSLIYSTFLAGGLGDVANSIALASDGTVYIAGTTGSPDYPVTRGAFQVECGKATDAFLTRLNASGTGLVFSSCLGGTQDESGNAVVLDNAGNPYLAGATESSNFLTSATAFQRTCGDDVDAFVTKWTQDGTNLFYSTCLGGSDDDAAFGLAVDSAGNVAVTGSTDSNNFPITRDAFHTRRGDADAFVARISPDGAALLSSTFLGGDDDDSGAAIALSADGTAWVAGTTSSNNFLTAAPGMQRTRIGDIDLFISRVRFAAEPRINPNGIVNAATFQPGVAPLGLVTIFGNDLVLGTEEASATPLPRSLAGSEVLVNGVPAPLVFAQPDQINFQLPSLPAGPAAISVRLSGGAATANTTVQVLAAAPGIFFRREGNTDYAIAQNQNASLNTPQNPARPGDTVVVYLTGIGPVDNFVEPGWPTPPIFSRAVLPWNATIGGRAAQEQFLGLTPGFVGLAQANLVVPPDLPPGQHAVRITVGGNSSNTAMISVGSR